MSLEMSAQRYAVLNCLSSLPKKILSLHGTDNVTEFVLHDLANNKCFNLKTAAFFIDNPDFDCLKGVAGFSQSEQYAGPESWNNPEKFSEHMRTSQFNNKVRAFEIGSLQKSGKSAERIAQELAERLSLNNPTAYTFAMKHNNQGLLLFERQDNENNTEDVQELMPHGACLLGFCPVF
jgi:hypothetical protein